MRSVFLFLFGWLVGACATSTVATVTPTAPLSHAVDASELANRTVALVGVNEDGELRAYCSGVWVSGDQILTAAHCVSDSTPGDVLGYVGRDDLFAPGSHEANLKTHARLSFLEAVDEAHDLALVSAMQPPAHSTAFLSAGGIYQGDFAQAMGHSLGLWWSYSSGEVSALRRMNLNGHDIVWIQTTAPVSPGNSGGGLFDEQGMLIGICHGSFTRGQLLNLFVHRDYIAAFLKEHP